LFGIILSVAIWAVATEKTVPNKGWKSVHPLAQAALTSIDDYACVNDVDESVSMDDNERNQAGEILGGKTTRANMRMKEEAT